MTTETTTELDALVGEGDTLTLASGLQVTVERLKTRQLFKFVKILTSGAGALLGSLNLSAESAIEDFASQLLAILFVAIPEAEDEAIEFILSMVSPLGLVAKPRTQKERDDNETLFEALVEELSNPELDDLISIFERVVNNEAPHIQALGKRLISLVTVKTSELAAKS